MTWFWNWLSRKVYRPPVYLVPCPECANGTVKNVDGSKCATCNGAGILATRAAAVLMNFLAGTTLNPENPAHIDALEKAMREHERARRSKIMVP